MATLVERTLRALVKKGLEFEALQEALPVVVELRHRWNEFVDGLGELAITLPLPLASGGTGSGTAAGARTNLGLGDLAVENSPLSIAKGGTNAATAAAAFGNLKQVATDVATGVLAIATENQMESATDVTGSAVTPGRVRFNPGVAKFWAQIDGDGVGIDESLNVASVDDDGTGQITVHYTTAFSGINYYCNGWAKRASTSLAEANMRHVQGVFNAQDENTMVFECFDQTNTTAVLKDPQKWYVLGFGEQ